MNHALGKQQIKVLRHLEALGGSWDSDSDKVIGDWTRRGAIKILESLVKRGSVIGKVVTNTMGETIAYRYELADTTAPAPGTLADVFAHETDHDEDPEPKSRALPTRTKSLRFTVDEWAAIDAAAEAAHLTSHAWIRIVVNAALGSTLPEDLDRVRPDRYRWPSPPDCVNIDIPHCSCGRLMDRYPNIDGKALAGRDWDPYGWICRTCGIQIQLRKDWRPEDLPWNSKKDFGEPEEGAGHE